MLWLFFFNTKNETARKRRPFKLILSVVLGAFTPPWFIHFQLSIPRYCITNNYINYFSRLEKKMPLYFLGSIRQLILKLKTSSNNAWL